MSRGFDMDLSDGWQCWSFRSHMCWPFVCLALQMSVYSHLLPPFNIRLFGGYFALQLFGVPCVFWMLTPCQMYRLQVFPPFLYVVKHLLNNLLQTFFIREKETRWWGSQPSFWRWRSFEGAVGAGGPNYLQLQTSYSKQAGNCTYGRVNKDRN